MIGQPFLSFRRNLSMFGGTLFHWFSPFLILSLQSFNSFLSEVRDGQQGLHGWCSYNAVCNSGSILTGCSGEGNNLLKKI
jgi:hypothetical protein